MCMCIYIYIYIYIERERERERYNIWKFNSVRGNLMAKCNKASRSAGHRLTLSCTPARSKTALTRILQYTRIGYNILE